MIYLDREENGQGFQTNYISAFETIDSTIYQDAYIGKYTVSKLKKLFKDFDQDPNYSKYKNSSDDSESESVSDENIPYSEPRNVLMKSMENENLNQMELSHAMSTPVTPLSLLKTHISSKKFSS